MQTLALDIASLAFTWSVFGGLGYFFAKRFKQPVSIVIWVLIILATAFAVLLGTSAKLISVFGFEVFLNWSLRAFGIGLIIGLLVRLLKVDKVHTPAT